MNDRCQPGRIWAGTRCSRPANVDLGRPAVPLCQRHWERWCTWSDRHPDQADRIRVRLGLATSAANYSSGRLGEP